MISDPLTNFSEEEWLEKIEKCTALSSLFSLKSHIFGSNGWLTQAFQRLKETSHEEKKEHAKYLNEIKNILHQALFQRQKILESLVQEHALVQEFLDLSIPPINCPSGTRHPLTVTLNAIETWFQNQGFKLQDGPEIETDFFNFTALNVSEIHPSRSIQDTFYIKPVEKNLQQDENGIQCQKNIENNSNHDATEVLCKNNPRWLLRTQTSSVQIRTLQKYAPPVRIISSGRVYRPDEIDATHSPMFHQIEGLVIEPGIHMGHLKGVLTAFLNWFFGERVRIQLRPTFFPFTEPSADVHIVAESVYETALKNNTTIPWLEVLGCGMVHPKVLKSCGLDSKIYQGFAFGMGLERLTMLKQGWSDIRELYKNDVRWLLKNNNIQKHAEGDK